MSARICLSPIPSTTSRNGKARTVTTANPANTHASRAFPRISGAAHTRSHDNLSGHIRRVDQNISLASRVSRSVVSTWKRSGRFAVMSQLATSRPMPIGSTHGTPSPIVCASVKLPRRRA
jgi:hypothetical protein